MKALEYSWTVALKVSLERYNLMLHCDAVENSFTSERDFRMRGTHFGQLFAFPYPFLRDSVANY